MTKGKDYYFPHQRLEAYEVALRFYDHVLGFAGPHLRRGQSHYDQLVDASESILRNLAEGGSSLSPGTKSRFYRIAEGSAGECAGCLDVIQRKFPELKAKIDVARPPLLLVGRLTFGLIRAMESRR